MRLFIPGTSASNVTRHDAGDNNKTDVNIAQTSAHHYAPLNITSLLKGIKSFLEHHHAHKDTIPKTYIIKLNPPSSENITSSTHVALRNTSLSDVILRPRRSDKYWSYYVPSNRWPEKFRKWQAGFPPKYTAKKVLGAKDCLEPTCLASWSYRMTVVYRYASMWSNKPPNYKTLWGKLAAKLPGPGERAKDPNIPDWTELSVAFTLFMCWQTKSHYSFCPDVCHEKCNGCKKLGRKTFSNEISCTCDFTFKWSQKHTKCARDDVCKNKKSKRYPCTSKYATSCKLTPKSYKCQCVKEKMGQQCTEKRNPCVENYNADEPSGNEACGDYGECKGNGFTEYTCTCSKGWLDDPRNTWPDCQIKDPCTTLPCFHGKCSMNKAAEAGCKCNTGYAGDSCLYTEDEIKSGKHLKDANKPKGDASGPATGEEAEGISLTIIGAAAGGAVLVVIILIVICMKCCSEDDSAKPMVVPSQEDEVQRLLSEDVLLSRSSASSKKSLAKSSASSKKSSIEQASVKSSRCSNNTSVKSGSMHQKRSRRTKSKSGSQNLLGSQEQSEKSSE